jgi:2-oxoglutarate dehydrogenase E1 component
LLRIKQAGATRDDLVSGRFQPVLDDPVMATQREQVRRLVVCSGKIYYDLTMHPERAKQNDLAVARIELLEPFPADEIAALIASYPRLEHLIWAQEEPRNMGAAGRVIRRLEGRLPGKLLFEYVGRAERASPSEGSPGSHRMEQARIVNKVLELANS